LSRINLDEFTITTTDVETVLIQAKGGDDRLIVENIEDGSVTFVDFRGGDSDDELHNRGGTDSALYANSGAGDDYLNGARGDDILIGGSGDDLIFGRDSVDRLLGQTGDDRLFGGGKRDVFVFASGDGDGVIINFQKGFDQVRFNGVTFAELTFMDVGPDNGSIPSTTIA
jgi:Ca2+-binding RTX toxin-like protein